MTKEELEAFQNKMIEDFGKTCTIKVKRTLDQEERSILIAHVKQTVGNQNISVRIIEPVVPDFEFVNDMLPTASALQYAKNQADHDGAVERKKPYDEKWTVYQNNLLNAISPLDLNERRLIMFLSPLVRLAVDKNPNQRTFVVKVIDFTKEFNIKSHAYYAELEHIVKRLQQKFYEYWDFKADEKDTSKVRVTWISKGNYKENQGSIHIDLHDDLIEMLSVFDKQHPYTKYERKSITQLGSHGIVLFELIASCMFQQNKQRTYSINFLREKFNCVDAYPSVSDFKRYVLDSAIKDIETYTPYRISYKQEKTGRMITGIAFRFKDISAQKQTIIKEAVIPSKMNSNESTLISKGNPPKLKTPNK